MINLNPAPTTYSDLNDVEIYGCLNVDGHIIDFDGEGTVSSQHLYYIMTAERISTDVGADPDIWNLYVRNSPLGEITLNGNGTRYLTREVKALFTLLLCGA